MGMGSLASRWDLTKTQEYHTHHRARTCTQTLGRKPRTGRQDRFPHRTPLSGLMGRETLPRKERDAGW